MRVSLSLITAPNCEPVSLQEVKSWARITDNDDDALLQNIITSARQEAEKYLRSVLITQTWEATFDLQGTSLNDVLGDGVYEMAITELYGNVPNVIALPYAPIQSIITIKTFDLNNTLTTYDAANYTLDTAGGRVLLNQGASWPSNMRRNAAMQIRYVAGYGAGSSVPASIKIAIMSYAQAMYESRGICDAVADPLKDMQHKLAGFRNMTI